MPSDCVSDEGSDGRRQGHRQPAADDHSHRRSERRRAAEARAENPEQCERDERRRDDGGDPRPGGRGDDREQWDRGCQRERAGRHGSRLERTSAARLDDAELVAQVGGEGVGPVELDRNLACQLRIEAAPPVDRGGSSSSRSGSVCCSRRSRAMSARSVSRWLLTELYSPVAIDVSPAATPANPATMIDERDASDAATPMSSAAIDTMPSPAPSTPGAGGQPMRPVDTVHVAGGRRDGRRPARRSQPIPLLEEMVDRARL